MHKTQSKDKASNHNVQRVDNKMNKWRTYYARRFIYKAITYEWLIITRKNTCNLTHLHIDRRIAI